MIFRILLFLFVALAFARPSWSQNLQVEKDYALAADHYRNGRWELATSGFQRLISQYPQDQQSKMAHFFLGEVYLLNQKYEQSQDHLTKFLKQFPDHQLTARAKFRLGECLYLLGRNPQAIQALDSSARSEGGSVFREFSWLYLGEMHLKVNGKASVQKSLDYFHRGLETYPASPLSDRYRLGLAKCYQQLGDFRQASRFFRFLLKAGDSKIATNAKVALASISVGKQDWAEARRILDDTTLGTLQGNVRTEAVYWRGRAEMGQKNWKTAAFFLTEASRSLRKPILAQAATYDAAVAHLQNGNVAQADQLLRKSIQTWPNGRWVAGVSFLYIDSANRRHDYEEVLKRTGEIPDSIRSTDRWAMIQETVGRAAFQTKKYSKAEYYFQNLVKWADAPKRPDEATSVTFANKWKPTWYYLLGLSLLHQNRTEAGLEAMKQVARLTDSNQLNAGDSNQVQGKKPNPQWIWLYSNARYNLSSHLVKKGHWQEAAEIGDQLLKLPLAQDLQIRILADQVRCYGMLGKSGKLQIAQGQLAVLESRISNSKEHGGREGVNNRLVGYAKEQQEIAALRIAQKHYKEKEWKKASTWFRAASASLNKEVASSGLSGMSWCEFHLNDTSNNSLLALMDRFPESRHTAEAVIFKANQLIKLKEMKQARGLLERIEQKGSRLQDKDKILALLAKIDLASGTRSGISLAIDRLSKAIAVQESRTPANQDKTSLADYHYQTAWALLDLKKDQSAASHFHRIYTDFVESPYWPESAYRTGEAHYKSGKVDFAHKVWSSIIDAAKNGKSVSPDVHAHTLFMISMVAVRKDQWKDVFATISEIPDRFPEHALAHQANYWAAESLYRQNLYQKAVDRLIQVVPRTNGVSLRWAAMSHLRLAQGFAQLSRWEDAREIALGITEKFPEFPLQFEADVLIGRSYASDGDFDDARKYYRKVVESPKGKRTETAAMAQWLIGESFFHQEKYESAADAYHRCNTLYPYEKWKAISLLQAGKCYEYLGKPEIATGYFRQIIKQHPGSSLATKAQSRLAKLEPNSARSGRTTR